MKEIVDGDCGAEAGQGKGKSDGTGGGIPDTLGGAARAGRVHGLSDAGRFTRREKAENRPCFHSSLRKGKRGFGCGGESHPSKEKGEPGRWRKETALAGRGRDGVERET